jgi:hypothetical protein
MVAFDAPKQLRRSRRLSKCAKTVETTEACQGELVNTSKPSTLPIMDFLIWIFLLFLIAKYGACLPSLRRLVRAWTSTRFLVL